MVSLKYGYYYPNQEYGNHPPTNFYTNVYSKQNNQNGKIRDEKKYIKATRAKQHLKESERS